MSNNLAIAVGYDTLEVTIDSTTCMIHTKIEVTRHPKYSCCVSMKATQHIEPVSTMGNIKPLGRVDGITINRTLANNPKDDWRGQLLKRRKGNLGDVTQYCGSVSENPLVPDLKRTCWLLFDEGGEVLKAAERFWTSLWGTRPIHYVPVLWLENEWIGRGLGKRAMAGYIRALANAGGGYSHTGTMILSPAAIDTAYQVRTAVREDAGQPPLARLEIERRLMEGTYKPNGFSVCILGDRKLNGGAITIMVRQGDEDIDDELDGFGNQGIVQETAAMEIDDDDEVTAPIPPPAKARKLTYESLLTMAGSSKKHGGRKSKSVHPHRDASGIAKHTASLKTSIFLPPQPATKYRGTYRWHADGIIYAIDGSEDPAWFKNGQATMLKHAEEGKTKPIRLLPPSIPQGRLPRWARTKRNDHSKVTGPEPTVSAQFKRTQTQTTWDVNFIEGETETHLYVHFKDDSTTGRKWNPAWVHKLCVTEDMKQVVLGWNMEVGLSGMQIS